MKDKEKEIRSALDETFFREDKFTAVEKSKVMQKIQPTRKVTRPIPVIIRTIAVVTLLFIGLLFIKDAIENSEHPETTLSGAAHPAGEFQLSEVFLNDLEPNNTYYLVFPMTWNGQKPTTIESMELFKDGQLPIQTKDGFSYTMYTANFQKKPGIYVREKLGKLTPVKGFSAKEKQSLVMKISVRNVTPDKSRTIRIRYVENGVKREQNVVLGTIQSLSTLPDNSTNNENAIVLSEAEQNVYSAFQQDFNLKHLEGLSPMSIAKLYIHASYNADYDVVYALYTDRKDYIQWTKKEDQNIPKSDRPTPKMLDEQYQNFIDGIFKQTSYYEGYIEFYPNGDSEPYAGFQLIRNKDDIWQVAFMPLQ